MRLSTLICMVALLALPSHAAIAQGAIQVDVKAKPGDVGAGGSAMISVLARNKALAPVFDAVVSITCDRGVFGVAAFTATGKTDRQGRFNAVWRAGPEGKGRLVIEARKRGMRPGTASVTLPTQTRQPEPRVQPEPHVRPKPHVPPGVRKQPPPRVIERAPVRIIATAKASPSDVPAGGSTTITVLALTPAGGPIAAAIVKLATGGGVFAKTGAAAVTGLTDLNGRFMATWRTQPEAAYRNGPVTYGFSASVGKTGHVAARTEFEVKVVPKSGTGVITGVIPMAQKMGISVTARPNRIQAGGATALYVSVTDAAGHRVAGARVSIHATAGEFRNTRGLTATGTTDANGNFMIQWRTAHPNTYPRDVDQPFDIKVEKQGHQTSTTRSTIRIKARRVQ